MVWIALEGCDGVGKSTIADAVIQILKNQHPKHEVKYLHFSQLDSDALDEYALQFEDYVPGSSVDVVCDRWSFGELIYGPLYRMESQLTDAQFRWTELYMETRGATTFHVTASLDTLLKRLEERGEDYLELSDVEHVQNEFKRISEMSLTMSGTAITDEWSVWDIAEHIVDTARYKDSQASSVYRPEYIGRALPTVLLVGDVKGSSSPGVTEAPFMPRGASCGSFLLDALPERWWHQLGVVNAQETDLRKLWKDLFNPQVVALGSAAQESLEALEIPHGTVPHPQKVRRFNHDMKSQYGTLIRQASTDLENYLSWPKS